jgi:hypothetical protein
MRLNEDPALKGLLNHTGIDVVGFLQKFAQWVDLRFWEVCDKINIHSSSWYAVN